MAMSMGDHSIAGRYVKAAGSGEREHYAVKVEELAWLLETTFQWNTLRLGLLTALQTALPLPRDKEGETPTKGDSAGELKKLLTDIIIMQRRVNDREEALSEVLGKISEDRTIEDIAMDSKLLARSAECFVEAYSHLQHAASGAAH